jgi:hypothetical protein
MQRKQLFLGSAVFPVVAALASSVVMWPNVSLAAKIAFFGFGAWFAFALSGWLVSRKGGRPDQPS